MSTVAGLPYLDPEELGEEDGASVNLESEQKRHHQNPGPKRQTVLLPLVGLDAEKPRPRYSVGVNKVPNVIVETLPREYDSRVTVMQVNEWPMEHYSDIGSLDKQIQELVEAVILPVTHKDKFAKMGINPPKGTLRSSGNRQDPHGPWVWAAQTKSTYLKLVVPPMV